MLLLLIFPDKFIQSIICNKRKIHHLYFPAEMSKQEMSTTTSQMATQQTKATNTLSDKLVNVDEMEEIDSNGEIGADEGRDVTAAAMLDLSAYSTPMASRQYNGSPNNEKAPICLLNDGDDCSSISDDDKTLPMMRTLDTPTPRKGCKEDKGESNRLPRVTLRRLKSKIDASADNKVNPASMTGTFLVANCKPVVVTSWAGMANRNRSSDKRKSRATSTGVVEILADRGCDSNLYDGTRSPNNNKLGCSKVNRRKAARMTNRKTTGAKLVWSGSPYADLLREACNAGDWPDKWTKDIFQRTQGATKGRFDSYYFSPNKKYKLRSLVEVEWFLKILGETQNDEDLAWLIFKQKKTNQK
jgi:hypothetical protein